MDAKETRIFSVCVLPLRVRKPWWVQGVCEAVDAEKVASGHVSGTSQLSRMCYRDALERADFVRAKMSEILMHDEWMEYEL